MDELSLADWREVIVQVGRDKPGGVVLVADSLDRGFVSTFDVASTYNITGQTQHKSPQEIRAWAHATYPKMVAAAGSGKIATVTIIPGYDDRNLWRLPPRPEERTGPTDGAARKEARMEHLHGLRLAWRAVARNRLRSFLMMLGVLVGVASLTALDSVGESTRRETLRRFQRMVGTFDTVIVRPGANRSRGMPSLTNV